MQSLSLYELTSIVRDTIELSFHQEYWMVAELSEARVGTNGHCYLEFVEKSRRNGALLAKARGHIWKSTYQLLAPYFEKATGTPLVPGLQVRVLVSITFHEIYGFALSVCDIDPSYTLGESARKRKEILDHLEAEGVLTLNKELPLPRLLQRIAVISSPTAAGYGDFCQQLAESPYHFSLGLYEAAMQGEKAESTIIEALNRIAADESLWDVVVIIRGGGASSELSCFDTYELATNVAQFPLPIFIGIGHERDESILDHVAHTRFKTPTAVAAHLITRQGEEAELLTHFSQRLATAATSQLKSHRHQWQMCALRLQAATRNKITRESERHIRLTAHLALQTHRQISAWHSRLTDTARRIKPAALRCIEKERHNLQLRESILQMASPERILQMGYSLTLHQGKAVRDAESLKAGDIITTCVANGTLQSVVCENAPNKNTTAT